MSKNDSIFREKSIERISSPDQLNDYIRLTNPGVWFILCAILVLLAGTCVFGVFGHIDSTVPAVGVSSDGRMVCLVKEKYKDHFREEMKVVVENEEYPASLRAGDPVPVPETADSFTLFIGDLKKGEKVYEVTVDGSFKNGTYAAKLITEQISPLSFLLNNR